MEWWQIVIAAVMIVAVEIYICGLCFFTGLAMDTDVEVENLLKEFTASFFAAAIWPFAVLWSRLENTKPD